MSLFSFADHVCFTTSDETTKRAFRYAGMPYMSACRCPSSSLLRFQLPCPMHHPPTRSSAVHAVLHTTQRVCHSRRVIQSRNTTLLTISASTSPMKNYQFANESFSYCAAQAPPEVTATMLIYKTPVFLDPYTSLADAERVSFCRKTHAYHSSPLVCRFGAGRACRPRYTLSCGLSMLLGTAHD